MVLNPADEHNRNVGGDGRAQRIERVVAQVVRERSSGVFVDEAALQAAHADLMPELGQRLRLLRALDDALLDTPDASGQEKPLGESAEDAFDEDARFIERELPRYEILELIAHGGQGVVYKAWDASIRRYAAIKVLLHGPFATREQRHRLLREARLIARIQHPHIVTSYESGEVGGRQYFAMEYVEGLPIDDHVLLNDLGVRDIVRLFIQVCRAVSTAHQSGVIHRDLKPSNILVNLEGEPKILDFGLAKDLGVGEAGETTQVCSEVGHVVGTLPYLSPEQAEDSTAIDVRSDIYTLGVLLFRLLTGSFPYPVEGPQDEVRRNIRCRDAQRLNAAARPSDAGPQRTARFDRDLEAVVAQALAKEKERRYQSVDGLAADLEHYLAGEAISARVHQTGYVLRKALARHRVAVGVGTAFALVIVVALVVTTALWRRAEYLVTTYQAGLEMGSYFKLATVDRDDGRIDQAIAMFEKVIELGENSGIDDPVVLRSIFDAHERLADVYLRYYEDAARARPHVEAARQLASRANWPGRDLLQLSRIKYRAKQIEARAAYSKKDYVNALALFRESVDLIEEVRVQTPASSFVAEELAGAYQGYGAMARRLGQMDVAYDAYQRSYTIAQQLAAEQPQSASRVVALAVSELSLAVWHLSWKTVEGDEAASPWLRRAEATLNAAPPSAMQLVSAQKCRDAIAANHTLIERRAARRARPVEASGPEAVEDTAGPVDVPLSDPR